MKVNVFSDNGGFYHLAVLSGDRCVYYLVDNDAEFIRGTLRAILAGEDPADFDGGAEDPAAAYAEALAALSSIPGGMEDITEREVFTQISDPAVAVEVLKSDHCTGQEARRDLENGTIIYTVDGFINSVEEFMQAEMCDQYYLEDEFGVDTIAELRNLLVPGYHSEFVSVINFFGTPFVIEYVVV